MSLIRFGLFVVANIGIFGAGIVLAAPLAGAIVLVAGAVLWVVASLVLHHGPDYVMLTPPGLLLVSAVLAGVAHIRRPPKFDDDSFGNAQAAATQRAAMADNSRDDQDADEDEESAALPVGASFFGDAGTATPMRGAMAPEPARTFSREEPRDAWEPVRRRVEPPRQKSMFVSPEDEYDDEESGFSRVARLTSSVLSFGLYAALAGAAVLIVWNLRAETGHPSATKIEASASVSSASAKPSAPASTQVAQAPGLVASQTPAPSLPAPAAPTLSPSSAAPASSDQLPADRGLPLVTQPIAEATPSLTPPQPDSTTATASTEPSVQPAGDDLAGAGEAGPLMPFPMPPEVAAFRAKAASAPAAAAPAPTTQPKPRPAPAPRNDTGL